MRAGISSTCAMSLMLISASRCRLSPSSPGWFSTSRRAPARRIGEILDELISLASVKIRVETDPSRLRVNETPFANADASRIRGLLGWEPHIAWSKTLADVLEFWRAAARRRPGPQTVFGHDAASHRRE